MNDKKTSIPSDVNALVLVLVALGFASMRAYKQCLETKQLIY